MKTDEIREAYMRFFETKDHVRRPSDVLVPKGDPTVLFTPAGMNQFKRQFLGIGKLAFTRATTCQKCIRTGDIDNVGRTDFHETFFEMLGNFSFGDYFKREAIGWAWEFLLQELKLPAEKLSVSVYKDDDEAYGIWRDEIGVPAGKIQRLEEDENFWPASAPSQGPNGVCGPCSEIFYNRGDTEVEIWNLVFTQFNRQDGGKLDPLPNKNIDTGMGMERTAAVMQGVGSVFDTDIFQPILGAIVDLVGRKYGEDPDDVQRMRRIADHARAVTFCVHENVFPTNEKQGYVVKRLLRRAVLDGYRMGLEESFVHKLCPVVGEVMKAPYPEVAEHIGRTANIIRLEEEKFLETLEVGTRYLDHAAERLVRGGQRVLGGREAFRLHDTYGFPLELTKSILMERGLSVDRAGFDQEMGAQRQQAKQASHLVGAVFATGPLDTLSDAVDPTEFLGYEATTAAGIVKGIVVGESLAGQRAGDDGPDAFAIVLDQTPFYGEAGGQVGDTGRLTGKGFEFEVQNTQLHGHFVLHLGRLSAGVVHVGETVSAVVDADRRLAIRRAHSGTHLLHYALRQVLGRHAQQKGSKVEPDLLRFDFTHFQAITIEELEQIQRLVNERVREAAPVVSDTMGLEEARTSGATALFDEKYGDVVRVVRMGDYSAELCGGTHLGNTGQVGLVRVVAEESISAGTRRVTALTGAAAVDAMLASERQLGEMAVTLKTPAHAVLERVQGLADEVKRLKKQLAKGPASSGPSLEELLGEAVEVDGVQVVARHVPDGTPDGLRRSIDGVKKRLGKQKQPCAVMLIASGGGKVQLFAGMSKDLVDRGLEAVGWVKAAAKLVGGGGGGRPDLAQAGGKDASKVDAALAEAVDYMRQRLGSGQS